MLQTRLLPPSELRDSSMFSDLTGRFPATAMDGSQYILLSVYKRYIHLELLPNRTEPSLIIAYNNVHTWFAHLGHYIQFQVLDNEAPKGLQLHFRASNIRYQCVPPYNKRANKAERAIQTFKRLFNTNHQLNQTHQSPQSSATVSHQSSGTRSRHTARSGPSCFPRAAYRLHVSAYQQKAPVMNDADYEPTSR
jgi:hypothetical protein